MTKPVVVLILGMLLSTAASSADAMRCGNRLVREGDHQARVAGICGEPDFKEQRNVYRSGIPAQDFSVIDHRHYSVSRSELLIHTRSIVEVPVEVWVFNWGPRRLMREVVFIDGRVEEVNTLGYGY
jgi:hypothetical protein